MSRSVRRVAIAGGGIGGLAPAAFMRRAGVEVSVYEQAPELREIGAGLVVAPNTVRLLRRQGLHERLADTAVRLEVGWEFRRWRNGEVLFGQCLDDSTRLYGEDTWVVHRADLLAIRSAVPARRPHLGVRATGVEQDEDGIALRLSDGTYASADAVIAADGIHSVVGGLISRPEPPRYSGICAWRSLVPAEAVPEMARRPVQTVAVLLRRRAGRPRDGSERYTHPVTTGTPSTPRRRSASCSRPVLPAGTWSTS